MGTVGKKILVMGIGNVLLRDEGIGVHVVRELMKMEMPDDVEVLDGGTAAIDLLHMIEGREKMVVIDAMLSDDEKHGSIFRLTPGDIQPTFRGKTSLHQLGLIEVLEMADMTGKCPDTVIYAVVPKSIGTFGEELTPELEAQVPRLVELVLEELGIPREREGPPG
jgi:hydrogenase maturation protease